MFTGSTIKVSIFIPLPAVFTTAFLNVGGFVFSLLYSLSDMIETSPTQGQN
jgi:hypothetical protein